MLTLSLAALASALTSAWHAWLFRNREVRHHQELCRHQWTDAIEVAPPGMLGPRTRFYKRFCPACGLQMDCNADGSKYVPIKERR